VPAVRTDSLTRFMGRQTESSQRRDATTAMLLLLVTALPYGSEQAARSAPPQQSSEPPAVAGNALALAPGSGSCLYPRSTPAGAAETILTLRAQGVSSQRSSGRLHLKIQAVCLRRPTA
jgi:hypothetical protein